MEVRPNEPQVRAQADRNDVIDFRRRAVRDEPLTVRLDFTDRVTGQLHLPELLPGVVVSPLRG